MAVIDHDEGVVLLGQPADDIHLGDVPVHGEGAVGGDEAVLAVLSLLELRLEVVPVDAKFEFAIGSLPFRGSTEGGGTPANQEGRQKQMATAAVQRLKRKLPDRIASIRGDRSQRQFARDLGVFQQNVNRYESGTTPHTDFLITLSTKEKISLDWLLLGKGRMRHSR